MDVRGRSFLVTGASRGIGRALARGLAANGASVTLAARSAEALSALRREIEASGSRAAAFAGDVGDDEDARGMVETALEAFGAVDVLVNNAAVISKVAPVASTSVETWAEVLRVNVVGVANLIRPVLPRMASR